MNFVSLHIIISLFFPLNHNIISIENWKTFVLYWFQFSRGQQFLIMFFIIIIYVSMDNTTRSLIIVWNRHQIWKPFLISKRHNTATITKIRDFRVRFALISRKPRFSLKVFCLRLEFLRLQYTVILRLTWDLEHRMKTTVSVSQTINAWQLENLAHPRCKHLWSFSLFSSYCFPWLYCVDFSVASLYSLFYVTHVFLRFLHRGKPENFTPFLLGSYVSCPKMILISSFIIVSR